MKSKKLFQRVISMVMTTVMFSIMLFNHNVLEVQAATYPIFCGSSLNGEVRTGTSFDRNSWYMSTYPHHGSPSFKGDQVELTYGQKMQFWYEAYCDEGGAQSRTLSFNTYIEQGGRFSCYYWVCGCTETTGWFDLTISNGSRSYTASKSSGLAEQGWENDYQRDDYGQIVFDNLSAGTYTVTYKAGISGHHDGGERQAGSYIWGIKFSQPYEAHLVDRDNYDPSNPIDLTYKSNSQNVMQIPSAYAGSHWLRTKNFYSRATSGPVSERGANWGTNTTVNKYYAGYKYKGDSGTVSIPQYGSKTVYRYFEPIRYDVILHPNKPSNSTYDIVYNSTGLSGWTANHTGSDPTDTKQFVYNHISIGKVTPKYSLLGYHVADDNNWYDSATGTTAKYPYNSKTLTTKENDKVHAYTKWIPNTYTLTYNSNLASGSSQMQGAGQTTRTELNGFSEKTAPYTNAGIHIEHTKNNGGTALNAIVNNTTKTVTMDSLYGDLKAPRAGYNVNIYPHSNDTYVVDNTDLSNKNHTALANSNFKHFIESTFIDWYRPKAQSLNSNYIETVTDEYPTTNYRRINKDTKMTIPQSHTIYATWENNSQVIGVPKRKYTITFESNGGTFTQNAGDSIGTQSYSIEHSWLFEGWYNRPCVIQHVIGKDVDHQNTIGLGSTNTGGLLNNGIDAFTPTASLDIYAHWTDPGFTLPKVDKTGYEFIGWYTKPQKIDPSNTDDDIVHDDTGEYYGGNNLEDWDYDEDKSNFSVDSDLTLYAWYNKKPIFVDIYEGLFFEGQSVTYNDLIELIGVYDYEDNYIELQTQVVKDFFDSLIQKIDQDIATDENDIENLVQEKDLWIFEHDPEDDGYDPSELEEIDEKLAALRDHIAHLFEQKEEIEKERAEKLESITERAKLLTITIPEIDYYKTSEEIQVKDDHRVYEESSLTSSGIYKVEDNAEDNYDDMYLKTKTENIGKVDVTYQVHDEGIKFFNTLTGNVETIPNSDVTIEYTRRCQINFNYNPLMYIQGIIEYSSTLTDIVQSTIKQQAVFDSEDTQDNIPWWDKDTSDVDLLLHSEYSDTIQKMQDTIIVTGLSEYKFSSAFENEHPDAVQAFKDEFDSPEYSNNAEEHFSDIDLGNYYVPNKGMTKIYDKSGLLDYISSFKDDSSDYHGVTKDQIWRALRGISVTVDAHDQWGKWTSNNVSEENYNKPDREVDTSKRPDGYIPPFNGDNDLDDDGDDDYDDKIIQSEEERTTEIILVDNSGDVETIDGCLNLTRISSKIRYISSDYLDTLGENSFWGSTGVSTIKEILDKNSVNDTTSHNGTYKTKTDNTVEVNVRD